MAPFDESQRPLRIVPLGDLEAHHLIDQGKALVEEGDLEAGVSERDSLSLHRLYASQKLALGRVVGTTCELGAGEQEMQRRNPRRDRGPEIGERLSESTGRLLWLLADQDLTFRAVGFRL